MPKKNKNQSEVASPSIPANNSETNLSIINVPLDDNNVISPRPNCNISPENNFNIKPKELLANVFLCDGLDLNKLILFLLQIQEIILINFIPEMIILKHILLKTENPLRSYWIKALQMTNSWVQFKDHILEQVMSPTDLMILKDQLIYRRQQNNETLGKFIQDISSKMELLNINMSEIEFSSLIWGRTNQMTFEFIKFMPIPITKQELNKIASHLQSVQRQQQVFSSSNYNTNNSNLQSSSVIKICRYCKQSGHILWNCPVRPNQNAITQGDSSKN